MQPRTAAYILFFLFTWALLSGFFHVLCEGNVSWEENIFWALIFMGVIGSGFYLLNTLETPDED